MATARRSTVKVTLARLTSPLEVKNIKAGTTLSDFLAANELEYNSRIRVNMKAVGKTYALKSGDVVTVVTEVSGG